MEDCFENEARCLAYRNLNNEKLSNEENYENNGICSRIGRGGLCRGLFYQRRFFDYG